MRFFLPLIFVCASVSGTATAQRGTQDHIKSTHIVRGTVVGFEYGDYEHVIIRDRKGHEDSYFLGRDGIDYFCALKVKKPGAFTIQLVSTYIKEAGGRQDVQQISAATVGGESFAHWWKTQLRHHSTEWLGAKYQPMVDKLTRKN